MVVNLTERASALALDLLKAALAEQSPPERADSARLARMMNDPSGKAFTVQMVDQVFRSRNPQCQSARFRSLLKKFGAPAYLSPSQRMLMQLGALVSHLFPAPVMQAVASQLATRHRTGHPASGTRAAATLSGRAPGQSHGRHCQPIGRGCPGRARGGLAHGCHSRIA
jgi:hypothetical protein